MLTQHTDVTSDRMSPTHLHDDMSIDKLILQSVMIAVNQPVVNKPHKLAAVSIGQDLLLEMSPHQQMSGKEFPQKTS